MVTSTAPRNVGAVLCPLSEGPSRGAVWQLIKLCMPEWSNSHFRSAVTWADERASVLVSLRGQLIGVSIVWRNTLGGDLTLRGNDRYIYILCVRREYRGMGMASAMLRMILHSSDGPVWLHVHESNHSAAALYEKLDFHRRTRVPGFYSDGNAWEMVYQPR